MPRPPIPIASCPGDPPAIRPKPPPPALTLYAVVACCLSNATCDGCFGTPSSGGPCSNRVAISGGKCACNRVAVVNSRVRTISVRTYRCSARCGAPAPAYIPCVVFAAIIRAIPSDVRGPVLRPPCNLHRPFAIAGARHAQPVVRARAPHRGEALGSPRGLPFRSGPLSRFMRSMLALTRPLLSPAPSSSSYTSPALAHPTSQLAGVSGNFAIPALR